MSPEMIAMIGIGVSILSVQITTLIYLLQRTDKLADRISETRKELSDRMSALELETKVGMETLRADMANVQVDMANLRADMAELKAEMIECMSGLEVSLTERVARLEGVVLARTESDNGTIGAAGDD